MEQASELPLVSIITPSLNQKEFLPAAIESVLRQQYPRLEYLVVDGGSTDGSLEILRSYEGRLQWISEPDRGQADAINKGFRRCSGEIVAWINSDDLLLKGAVEKAVEAFRREPDLGMVYGEGYVIDEEGVIQRRFPYTAPSNLWRLVYYGDTILQQTVFMRRSALEEVGYLDETLHWGLDWDLFIRLGKRYRARCLPEYLGCLREYRATKTSTGGYRRLKELGRIIRRHTGRLFTPSYMAYANYYAQAQLPDELRAWAPGRLGDLAARGVQWLQAAMRDRVDAYVEDSQGWYPDGGAAPLAHFLLPNLRRPAQVVIEGRVPRYAEDQVRQSLTVVVNGRTLLKRDLAPGPFQVAERAPAWINDAEVLRVDLVAEECISERFYAGVRRVRRISYFVDRVDITPLETG